MKKILLAFCCVCALAFSDELDDKIKEIVGSSSYDSNKGFINTIFKNKSRFYANGQINIPAIVRELKNNGLISLKFPKPMDLNITFVSKTSPMLLTYTINSTLSAMGYSYFMVTHSSFKQGLASVRFSLVTEHSVDPTILINELQKRGFKTTDIRRKDMNNWEYLVSVENPRLSSAKPISIGESLHLREVSGEYWLQLRQTGNLTISTNSAWIPHIVCYDRNLRITNIITPNRTFQKFNINVGDNVYFMMITDEKNPNKIKEIQVKLSRF